MTDPGQMQEIERLQAALKFVEDIYGQISCFQSNAEPNVARPVLSNLLHNAAAAGLIIQQTISLRSGSQIPASGQRVVPRGISGSTTAIQQGQHPKRSNEP